jgi:proteasome lid subunit RPN8/RPN11
VSQPIRVSRDILVGILDHARQDPHHECCGLLGGRDGMITQIFPAVNSAKNTATSYEIAPEQLFQLMREMRAAGLRLMGIYHSHPNGKNEPSQRDVERGYYPDVAYFIVSPSASQGHAPVRAFSIRDGLVRELRIDDADLS